MHETQEKLLAFSQTNNLGEFSYYSLAKKFGVKHHNNIKYHLKQLIKNGYLVENKKTGVISRTGIKLEKPLLQIPIYGKVNCGEALQIADDSIKSYLKLSPSAIKAKNLQQVYALKAAGNSMNDANVNGNVINDGDYVIILATNKFESGDYVVSLFDNMANVKKMLVDAENSRYILVSESSDNYDPIIIAEEDMDTYKPIGKVIEVIKGVPS